MSKLYKRETSISIAEANDGQWVTRFETLLGSGSGSYLDLLKVHGSKKAAIDSIIEDLQYFGCAND